MRILQQLPKLILTALLFLGVHIGHANPTTDGKKANEKLVKEQQQAGQRQSQQRLDGEELQQTPNVIEEEREDYREDEIKTDSVEDDSVSKYNFIFYFLYKFKFEHEEL